MASIQKTRILPAPYKDCIPKENIIQKFISQFFIGILCWGVGVVKRAGRTYLKVLAKLKIIRSI